MDLIFDLLFQIEDNFSKDVFRILRNRGLAFKRILIDVGVLSFEIDPEEVGNAHLGGSGTEVDRLVVLTCGEDEFVRLRCFHVK